MKLSVVIVSYNVKYYLEQCLYSVERAIQGISAEVLVVDNASSDDSISYLQSRFPWVKFILNHQNGGFSHANNQAFEQAQGEYVLMLNPDTIVGEDMFANCIAFMDSHPEVGSTGVKMLNRNGTFALESRRGLLTPWVAFCKATKLCNRYPKSRVFGKYYMSYLDENQANPIDMVSGAYMFLRKEALDKVGKLDEQFFMYWEDTDLSYRLLKSGAQNYYLPELLFHYKGESSRKSTFRYRYYLFSSALIFFKKHFFLDYLFMYLPMIFSILFCRMRIHWGNRILYGKDWETNLANPDDCFLVLGSEDAIQEIKEICRQHSLNTSHSFVVANEQQLPDGHLAVDVPLKSFTHVLYDADSYSYKKMLELLQQTPGNTLKLATYSTRSKALITEETVYCLNK